MNKFKHLDFVQFHTPIDDKEKKQIFLVVDEGAHLDEVKSLKVMEIHQTLSIPCVNTFTKKDFKLFYRPTEEEIAEIKSGKVSLPKKSL